MEAIRKKYNIEKWLVFGGSWGSTLAMVYGVMHPEHTLGLILRGIYLGQRYETEWLYQPGGAAMLYPDEFEKYMSILNEDEFDDTVKAYYNRLTSDDEEIRNEAALLWSVWEGTISKLIPDPDLISDFGDPKKAVALSVLECTYFLNDLFFDEPDWLLKRVHELNNMPVIAVHGRYDIVCPMQAAWTLKKKAPNVDLRIIKDAGHNMGEPGIKSELVQAMEDFKMILNK
jgi:proline iminopeptidase